MVRTRALLEPKVEDRADRLANLATIAVGAVGLVGIFTADAEVPLQFDNRGWSSFAPAIVAAGIYMFVALFMRAAALLSSHPYVRWFGRAMILLILVLETVAFVHAS